MFRKLWKNKRLSISVIILLILIIVVLVIGLKQCGSKETGTADDKIEYGEDVSVENDTPGLGVSEDDGSEQNGISVPESWEDSAESNTANTKDNQDSKNDSTNTDSDNTDDNTTDKENSEDEPDEGIIEDDKSWGIIF